MSAEDPSSDVPSPGFAVKPPAAALPHFDPSDSPLNPGGRVNTPEPAPADSSLQGLKRRSLAAQPRVTYRVRREGWVARREAARSRFATLIAQRGSSASRLMGGLERRGVLERSKSAAVRPRFDLRGT